MEATVPEEKLGLLLKLGFYIFTAFIGLLIFAVVLAVAGYVIASVGSVFAAAITANALSLRVFERLPLPAVGLGWKHGSARNLFTGVLAGMAAAAAVTLVPFAFGLAEMVPDPERPASASGALFVSVMLVFGAIGEELLFRGYGFQTLVRLAGPVATLAITAFLFGGVHVWNLHASPLGIANTAAFGVVLGYAFLRSGELWLPIGIHFGWNWMLPLAGVNVSGFKMGFTGYSLRWNTGEIWSGGAYGAEASILTSAIVVMLLVLLWKAPLPRNEAPLLAVHRPET